MYLCETSESYVFVYRETVLSRESLHWSLVLTAQTAYAWSCKAEDSRVDGSVYKASDFHTTDRGLLFNYDRDHSLKVIKLESHKTVFELRHLYDHPL